MIKVFSASQVKELDLTTIRQEPIASIDLMERACQAFVRWFVARFDAANKIGVVCGTGNNGGDGLAIARMLHEWNYPVKVWVVKGEVKETEDFKKNLARLGEKSIEAFQITLPSDQGLFGDRQVLIDAVFGSGLSRPAEGIYAQVINCINQTKAITVSVDIPSGLFADRHSTGKIVEADFTVTFQTPKLAFFLPENEQYVGKWETVDIGLNRSFIDQEHVDHLMLSRKAVKKVLRTRKQFAHKGDFGKVLLVAGSYGKMGAAVLAARAALRAGLGLLTVHVPRQGYVVMQTAVPEAMTSVDANDFHFSASPATDSYDVIGVGPGLGQSEETIHAFQRLLEQGKPMVIDADGLNILAAIPEFIQRVPSGSILTPHPGEFARLAGGWSDDFERLAKQKELAARTRSIVVLKGAFTSVATPGGKVYFNSTGNPGMATGGSGDVLTGILTGLLAQKYLAEEAAILGVYLHGLSGDYAKASRGEFSLIASDLVDFLPSAFLAVTR